MSVSGYKPAPKEMLGESSVFCQDCDIGNWEYGWITPSDKGVVGVTMHGFSGREVCSECFEKRTGHAPMTLQDLEEKRHREDRGES